MSEQLTHLLLVGLRPTMYAPLEQFTHDCVGAIVVAEDLADAHLIVGEHARRYQHAVIDLTGAPANSDADRSASDLVARLREQTPSLQWIAITEPTRDARIAALHAGAYQALSEPFHPEELAIALERIQQFTQVQRHAEQLEQVRQTTLAITSQRRRKTLLPMIVEHAVSLLHAKSGGIYEYLPERGELEIVADYGRPSPLIGHTLRSGEGIAGRLILSGEPFLTTEDYDHCPYRADVFDRPRQFGAVLEVPLRWDDQVIGVLYIDDDRGRRFSDADVEALTLLADHAAIALVNANLTARELDKHKRLEKLARASNTIMDNLGALALDDRLTLIAEQTCDILGAESSGILLVHRPGTLTLEASHGHRPGGFEKGREFAIRDEPGGGLTGAIAARGELFNAHGEALHDDPARRGETPHTPSDCLSLLAIPLKRHTDTSDELIGLLRVDNKKDRDGQASPLISFNEEDAWLLHLFARAVLVAIEDAKLIAALRQQTDYLDRMIASLPNGVIVLDQTRTIMKFNQQAEAMLHYQQSEVLGKPVDALYDNAREPFIVGKKLHESPSGRVADHETFVRSKSGERIPIRLAATWIFDAQGQRIGSVGYFEDLRVVKETQRRLDVLLKASNIVAQADSFADGLTHLAKMLVTLLHSSFCRIFLIDESRQYLETAAVYPTPDDRARLDWTPALGARIEIASWPNLDTFLNESQPRVLRLGAPGGRAALEMWSRQLNLSYDLQSLVMIPLHTNERMVGLLDLGELRPWALAPFTPDMLHLATAIADHTAVLIERMRLYAETDRQRMQFAELDAAARQLRAEKDPARLYQTIVRLAVGLAGGSAGGLFLNHQHIEEVELVVADDFPTDNIGRRQHHSEGLIGHVARGGSAEIAYNYTYWHEQDPLLETFRFQSLIAVPLRHAGEVEAVLFIAHAANTYQFSGATLQILERFAIHASLVLRTARMMSREQRAFGHLAILHQMSDYIQTATNLEMLLHVALTTVTAGYGLGFNRAAVFLFNERRERLDGQMGIGHITPSEAEYAWNENAVSGLDDFRRFREQLEHRRLRLTPVGERVRQMRLTLGPIATDVFAQVVHLQKWRIVYPDEFTALPARFAETLQPTTPLLAVPLITRGTVIGMLVADNKFTREPITHELIDSLQAFANTTAIAIDSHLLLRDATLARQKLQLFYEASNALEWSQEPVQVLQEIVEQARRTAEARGATMILFDAKEQVRDMLTAGDDDKVDLTKIVRSNGISIEVLRTGEPVIVDDAVAQHDRVNRSMFDHGFAAGLCLPIAIKGQRLGVMWVHYDAPRTFPAAEIAAIQLYVNQAAIAYDNARQLEALRKARDTARIVAQLTTLGQLQPTLESLVAGTKNVLRCDAVSLYQYDHDHNLLQQPPITDGLLYPQRASRTDAHALAAESFVFAMLNLQAMELVEDTAADSRFVQRRFTREERVVSCGVIPLRVGAKQVGVMFINYRQPHQFLPDEVINIEIFAYQAAVAIYNAQLYDQVRRRAITLQRLYEAGRAIASTLSLPTILDQIAEQASALMSSYDRPSTCSALALLHGEQLEFATAYPTGTRALLHEHVGHAIDLREGIQKRIGIAGQAAITAASVRAGDTSRHPEYLAYLPDTRSELAVPMRIRDKLLGVINVEHREYNAFDGEHQQALELLAAQAAIAIENAQLFEYTRGLHAITLAASSALQLDDVLRATTHSIAHELRYESVGIHLIDEATGKLVGPTYYADGRPRKINTSPTKGITGRVARTGESALVLDVTLDHDYVVGDSRTRSELCVALSWDGKVVGVINVESTQLNAFSLHDQQQLETIARQVVNRIENARLYTQLEQTKTILAARTAVAWMGMVSANWQHAIQGHAATISTEINTIRAEFARDGQGGTAMPVRLEERLQKIRRMAQEILKHQIPPVPSSNDLAVSVQINDLLHERLRQLQENGDLQGVEVSLHSTLDDSATIRISYEWMCSLFDILIDNAVATVRHTARQQIRIGVSQAGTQAKLAISDTGTGIPKKLRKVLFHKQVAKSQGERGMGMGLLLAQTIAQTYGGEIAIGSTSSKGTTMIVVLPIEQARKAGA